MCDRLPNPEPIACFQIQGGLRDGTYSPLEDLGAGARGHLQEGGRLVEAGRLLVEGAGHGLPRMLMFIVAHVY